MQDMGYRRSDFLWLRLALVLSPYGKISGQEPPPTKQGVQTMIFTFTANPSVDYHMDLNKSGFIPGAINRSDGEELFPGGKGLNVSIVLSRLGIDNIAWGFYAGKTGGMLKALITEYGCRSDFICLSRGENRINVKLDCDMETAINGKGPEIDEVALESLLNKAEELDKEDTLILSGNLPKEKIHLYEQLAEICVRRGASLIVDAEGTSLRSTFKYRPFLIKPNKEELMNLFCEEDDSASSIIDLMKRCQAEGVMNVLTTIGKEGAVFLSQSGELYQARITENVQVVSTVGAGDSTIAGFLAGLRIYENRIEYALRLACAAGTATSCRKWLCEESEVKQMIERIEVSRCTI